MSKKHVTLKVDNDSEMLAIWLDDECWKEGNFWDFDFNYDLGNLLDELGIANSEEEYTYNDEEQEIENE